MAFSFEDTQPKVAPPKTIIKELIPIEKKFLDPQDKIFALSNAKNKMLRTLNALKIISPILQAIVINPDGKNGNIDENFKNIVLETSNIAKEVCQKFNIDINDEKNFWIRNSFERIFASIIKEHWIKYSEPLNSKFLIELVDIVEACDNFEKSDFQNYGLDIDTDLRMSIISNMTTLLYTMKNHNNLQRNVNEDIKEISELIFTKSKESLHQLVDINADSKQRASVLKMLISEGTQLYGSCWIAYSKHTQNILDNHPKKNELLKKYSNGFPIEQLTVEFNKNFDYLVNLTNKLIPNSISSLENRNSMSI